MGVYLSREERAELDELFGQEIGPMLTAGAKTGDIAARWLEVLRSIEQVRAYAVLLVDDFTRVGAYHDQRVRQARWLKAHFLDSDGKVRTMAVSRGTVRRDGDGAVVHHRQLIPTMTLSQLRSELRKLVTQRDTADEEIIAYRRLLVTYEAHDDAENVEAACQRAGTDWRAVLYGTAA